MIKSRKVRNDRDVWGRQNYIQKFGEETLERERRRGGREGRERERETTVTTSHSWDDNMNPLNPELYPICYLLALLGAHHFLHLSRIRVKLLTLRRLMSYIYIYGAPILDVSRSHTTTQHSR